MCCGTKRRKIIIIIIKQQQHYLYINSKWSAFFGRCILASTSFHVLYIFTAFKLHFIQRLGFDRISIIVPYLLLSTQRNIRAQCTHNLQRGEWNNMRSKKRREQKITSEFKQTERIVEEVIVIATKHFSIHCIKFSAFIHRVHNNS